MPWAGPEQGHRFCVGWGRGSCVKSQGHGFCVGLQSHGSCMGSRGHGSCMGSRGHGSCVESWVMRTREVMRSWVLCGVMGYAYA